MSTQTSIYGSFWTKITKLTAVIILAMQLAGCASTDGDRTRAEGTAAGAFLGALAGAGLGYLAGGEKGAIAGAIVGATLGGVGGYNWGRAVALKKESYKSQEDYYRANISEMQSLQKKAATENAVLAKEVAQMDAESKSLAQAYANKQATTAQMKHKLAQIEKRRSIVAQQIARITDEITVRRQVVADAKKSKKNTKEIVALDQEIQKLVSEKSRLEAQNKKLKEISVRCTV